jgi:hypothetical protein
MLTGLRNHGSRIPRALIAAEGTLTEARASCSRKQQSYRRKMKTKLFRRRNRTFFLKVRSAARSPAFCDGASLFLRTEFPA